MTRNLFRQLKKYTRTDISQDENYATEALATLLDEFPSYRGRLFLDLYGIRLGPTASVNTQVTYQTNRYGRAILDLVVEDDDNFVVVEVKVEAGLSYHEAEGEPTADVIADDQLVKYEDCVGFPPDKRVWIVTLSKYPLPVQTSGYKYYDPQPHQGRWQTVWLVTKDYCDSLEQQTPEKYLTGRFAEYLKEEGMAGFQGFSIHHIAQLYERAELDGICSDLKTLIVENVVVPGFKGSRQYDFGRDGIFYRRAAGGPPNIQLFVGLWLSQHTYRFTFPRETGPQALVFVEMPPRDPDREALLASPEYAKVSERFGRNSDYFQILLQHRPLTTFLGEKDQRAALLDFFRDAVKDLEQSGLLAKWE